MTTPRDHVEFDDVVLLALAESAASSAPRPEVKTRLMAAVTLPPVPDGFAFHYASSDTWRPHPVPGIRMKVLSLNRAGGYSTLLLDVAPGTRFPAHFHSGAEECYVLSGSLFTCGRHLHAGDFVHADANTHHDELFTEEGCQVLLIAPPEEFAEGPASGADQ